MDWLFSNMAADIAAVILVAVGVGLFLLIGAVINMFRH